MLKLKENKEGGNMLSITVKYKGEKYTYPKGTSLLEISKDFQSEFKEKIIVGMVDGDICDLSHNVFNNSEIDFFDRTSSIGNKVYESGLLFVLSIAFKEVLKSKIIVKYSLDTGIFIKTEKLISSDDLTIIKNKVKELSDENLPIDKLLINRKEAISYYEKLGELDKSELLKYNTNTNVNLYKLNNTYDYFFGNLPVSTSYIDDFKLTLIDRNSFVVTYPNIYTNNKLVYKHHEKLFNAFKDYSDWCNTINVNSICDLNNIVSEGIINDYILLAESYQNQCLYEIARKIFFDKNIKIVLISGPSSSGKTTFSKRLKLLLKGCGLNPKTISIDDYFVDREKTPVDEEGNYDYECLEAIKLDQFNRDLNKLLNGEKVKVPTYNFIAGKGEYIDEPMELKENEILIIEGLHALNNELTNLIPKKYKFKIYLSPLVTLNLDNHNRIKTTDVRILRRIIRDNRTRGYNVSDSLKSWKKVREGEEKYVFPYQDEADIIFNSSLFYELGVLKTYVEPLLFKVKEDDENYKEAVRLLNLLKIVAPIPSDFIAKDSIIREFIGNSYFEK